MSSIRSALMLVMATVGLGGCHPAPPPSPDVRPVRTVVAALSPVDAQTTYAGEVRPRYESSLGFRVAGKLTARSVNVGDKVRSGQVLARLDPQDLALNQASSQASVKAQDAQLEVETADLERYRALREKGFISGAEFQRQETRYKAAKAQLESMQAQARVAAHQTGYAELRADHDGVITAVDAEAGQVVTAGQVVFRLAQAGDKEISANVPEDQVREIHVGQPAVVSMWSAAGKTFDGVVRELSSSADPATRTYAVRVTLPETTDAVRLGMTASVRFTRNETVQRVHLPLPAIVQQDGKTGVWVVDPTALTVGFHPVQGAGVSGNQLLIADGIQPGDIVVTAGAPLLRAGQKVRLLEPVASN